LFSVCHTNHLMQSKYHLYSTMTTFMNNSKCRSNGTVKNEIDYSAFNRSQIATWFKKYWCHQKIFDVCCGMVAFSMHAALGSASTLQVGFSSILTAGILNAVGKTLLRHKLL
jgi:hypothetical protein